MSGLVHLALLLCVVCTVNGNAEFTEGRKSFRGYQVLSVQAKNQMHLEYLHLLESTPELDFFKAPSLVKNTDILVPPKDLKRIKKVFRKMKIPFEITNQDMETLIENERNRMASRSSKNLWKNYLWLEEIEAWLRETNSTKTSMVKLMSIGKSHENRNIWSIKVAANINAAPKPAIWIECLAHAREWISGSVCLGTIDMLIENYGKSDDTGKNATEMLNRFDWHFVPVLNPDGYKYTETNNRLWRKNKRPHFLSTCPGVDLNRNFDVKWASAGSSSNWCSDTYHGGHANSEPETVAIISAVQNTTQVAAYFSIHCFSQLLLVPYAHSTSRPDDYDYLKAMADEAMKALKNVYGTNFIVGQAPDILYPAAGGSFDFFKEKVGVKHSFVYELRPASGTSNGFVLPDEQIDPVIRETFVSLWSFADQIHKNTQS